jgi:hypothetical protein
VAIRNLFERRIFIRLDDDETSFTCTVKRWFISRKTRICVPEPVHHALETLIQKRFTEVRDAENGRRAF